MDEDFINILEEMENTDLKAKWPVKTAKSYKGKVKPQIPETLGSRGMCNDCLLLSYWCKKKKKVRFSFMIKFVLFSWDDTQAAVDTSCYSSVLDPCT